MRTLAKIRRLYFRDKQSIKEICRQTGMSRKTVRSWLRDPERIEAQIPAARDCGAAGSIDAPLSHLGNGQSELAV